MRQIDHSGCFADSAFMVDDMDNTMALSSVSVVSCSIAMSCPLVITSDRQVTTFII